MIRLRLDGADAVIESWRTLLAMLTAPLRPPKHQRPETHKHHLRRAKRRFRR